MVFCLVLADVDEFLRLTSNVPMSGDNPQMIRIRQVFEKKNKKSAHTIMMLQVRQCGFV